MQLHGTAHARSGRRGRQTGSDEDRPGGVIALEWPVPVTVETERDVKARELLLRFDQPLGTVPFARIQEVLGGLVETVEYGYDSVLIRVAPDVRVTPTNLASGVQIALSGAVEAAAGKPAAQSASQPGQSLTQADYLYISALEAMDNKPEQIRFWSGKLDAGVLSGKEATGAVHRLIALGADAQALPYLKRFARERKGRGFTLTPMPPTGSAPARATSSPISLRRNCGGAT